MSPDSLTSGWYYAKAGAPAGQETGPLSWEELYLLARAGTVTAADLVWNPKLPHGVAAHQIPGLFSPPLVPEGRPARTAPQMPSEGPPVLPAPPPPAPPLPPPVLPARPPADEARPVSPAPPPTPQELPILPSRPLATDGLPVLPMEPTAKPPASEPNAPRGAHEEATEMGLSTERPGVSREATTALEEPAPSRVKKQSRNLPWLVVLLAVVVAGAGLAAYFLFFRDDLRSEETPTASASPTTTVDGKTTPAAEAPAVWTQLHPAGTVPAARSGHVLVYDPDTSRAILFGGSHLDTNLGDTWAFDPTAGNWTQLDPGEPAPSARRYSQMVYDTIGGNMILFGGEDASGSRNDIWAYNPAAGTWAELSPRGVLPAPRFAHAMAYDPDSRRVILFGGVNSSTAGLLNDLWAYDLATDAWTRLEPQGILPVKRMWHSLVYDPGSRRVILFGGYGGASGSTGANLDDLWAYDPAANTWTELARVGRGPLAREGQTLVFDPRSGDLVLFGGCDGLTELDDVWSYDPATDSWAQSGSTGAVPAGRDSHAMTYDSADQAMILFGGYDFTGNFDFNDTWTYSAEPSGRGP